MYKLILLVLLGLVATENHLALADIGSLPPSNATCERGHTYYSECNVCNCDANGVLHCTQKHCTAQETDHKHEESCEPGSTFNIECHVCTCAENGKEALCTLQSCLPSHRSRRGGHEISCTPGSQIMLDCNQCTCGNDRKSASCILRACQPPNGMIRRKRDAGAQRCDPGSHFMQDCNTCICSIDGIVAHASCTINLCRNRRAIHSCEPGSIIHTDCNICQCAANGKVFSCTYNDCRS